jgi:hypothetical protein
MFAVTVRSWCYGSGPATDYSAATAAEAITAVAVAGASDRWPMAQGWLCARKPADAVRELLAAADPLPAWLRDAAATMAAMMGEDGLPGWHAIRSRWLSPPRWRRSRSRALC